MRYAAIQARNPLPQFLFNMKKVLVLLAALVATAAPAFAQGPGSSLPGATAQPGTRPQASPEQQATRRTQYLSKELSLSADQQARLQPILLAQGQELQRLRAQAGGAGRQGTGQQLKALQADYEQKIRAVLTPEQYTKFDQLKDERRDQLRERRAGGRAAN